MHMVLRDAFPHFLSLADFKLLSFLLQDQFQCSLFSDHDPSHSLTAAAGSGAGSGSNAAAASSEATGPPLRAHTNIQLLLTLHTKLVCGALATWLLGSTLFGVSRIRSCGVCFVCPGRPGA